MRTILAVGLAVALGVSISWFVHSDAASAGGGQMLNATYILTKHYQYVGTERLTMKFTPSGNVYETATGLQSQVMRYQIDGDQIIIGRDFYKLEANGDLTQVDSDGTVDRWKKQS